MQLADRPAHWKTEQEAKAAAAELARQDEIRACLDREFHERAIQERFEATWWSYREVVAWILHRTPAALLAILLQRSRSEKWYGQEREKAEAVLRRSIERAFLTAIDENGDNIKPAAVLGPDPKIRFETVAVKRRWTSRCSLLGDKNCGDECLCERSGSSGHDSGPSAEPGDARPKGQRILVEPRPRGSGGLKRAGVRQGLEDSLDDGTIKLPQLQQPVSKGGLKQQAIADMFGVSRDTAMKAVKEVLEKRLSPAAELERVEVRRGRARSSRRAR
jgi:hypothetical protein